MGISIDRRDVARLLKELDKLQFDAPTIRRVNRFAAAEVESAVKKNIGSGKKNEDGSSWARWKNASYRRRQNSRNRSEPNLSLIHI